MFCLFDTFFHYALHARFVIFDTLQSTVNCVCVCDYISSNVCSIFVVVFVAFSPGVLFVLVVAVTPLSSAIAVDQQQDGEKRRDWSGTTDRAEADGQPLIVEMEDSRSSRAAEIQATKLNFAAESSTSSSTTSTTTQIPTTTDEPDWSLDDKETASSTPSSETESLPTTSPSVVVSTLSTITSTIANLNSSSAAEEEEEEIRRFATTTTPASTTNDQVSSSSSSTVTNMNGDEYVADDHRPSLTTDNEGIIDQEMEHKSGSTLSAIQAATTTTTTTTTEVPVTWTATSTTTIKPLSHLMTAAAVGRSLAQEENVAWPESKSTKVIGTIIEDIHSPAASSSSTAAESITNGSIVAIALCSVCLIVSSLGE